MLQNETLSSSAISFLLSSCFDADNSGNDEARFLDMAELASDADFANPRTDALLGKKLRL